MLAAAEAAEAGAALAYDRVGSGPALALLGPLGSDRSVWAPIVERLQDRRELIAIDLPGFGQSAPLSATTPTPRALAAAVAGLLDDLGLERVHGVGNSLGGWVALELGLARRTVSTTAIAPAGLWSGPLLPKPNAAHRLAKALLPVLAPVAATPPGRRLLLANAVAHPERMPGTASAQLVRAYARAPGFVAVNRAMRAGRFTELDRIGGPVTLVWPEHDRLVTRPRRLPDNVRSIPLADAGHIPFWDQPDRVAEILLEATGG